jgi:hypothetical protein
VVRWVGLSFIALLMFLAGWFQVSGRQTLNAQMGPSEIAVGGAIVFGAANVMWIMKGRRVLGERISLSLDRFGGPDLLAEVATSTLVVSPADTDRFVAVPGTRHFHRPTCYMAANRDWIEGSEQQQRHAGRQPCGVCRP